MSFQGYQETKNSGIEWCDQLPIHWDKGKIRWLCNRYSGGTPDRGNHSYWDNGSIPWLNSGAVNDRLIHEPSALITERALVESSAKWIPAGSLLIALAGQGKTKGMVAQLAFRATCNQSMAAIVPTGKGTSRYLFWWLDANYQNIRNMAGGDLRDGLNLQLLGDITCPIPPKEEQQSISNFLDHETAKIDDLIAEQKRLIELLKEKRQAVISHTVTKGLNPDAPMKDSGVEWLGEIPVHWQIKRVKHCIDPVRPVTYGILKPGEIDEDGVPMIRAQDYSKEWNQKSEILMVSAEVEAPYIRSRVRTGDVLITAVGAGIGNCAVVPDYLDGANISRASCRISVNSQKISGSYLLHALKSITTKTTIELAMRGAAQPVLNNSEVENLLVPLPPLEEQSHLVQALDFQVQQLDKQQDLAFLQIELLKERRSALISAAVTGQIDVRGLAKEEAP